MSTNRLLAVLLGVLALLVVVVAALSITLSGRGPEDEGPSPASPLTTDVGGTNQGADGAGASGVLRIGGSEPVTLDPHLSGDAGSAEYVVEIYSGLVTISPDVEIALDLAASVDISDDGSVYTFVLRDDIFFHTGRRVTAEDVVWSLERAASRELQSPLALAFLGNIIGAREYNAGLAENISGLELVDERTVRMTLNAPTPVFLAKLSYPTAFVVDRQQIEANPRNWTRNPNGTGPYRLAEWRLGERIVLESNPRYHLGEPPLGEVFYSLSGGSQLTRFENGELDVSPIGVNDIDRARDPNSDLNALYSVWPELTVWYLAFNAETPPFDDRNFRRALGLAIDRATITEVTFNNMLLPATGILMPGLPGFAEGDKTLPFDPDAARAALAESKYTVEDGKVIDADGTVVPVVITEVGGGAQAGTDTQAYLEQWRTELGIAIEIRQTDSATYLAELDARNIQMYNAGWIMDYPDPEDILDLKLHSRSTLNNTAYSNPEVDALLEQARTELDAEARFELYREAEVLLLEDAAWLPLYFSQKHVVVSDDVVGWFEPPMVIPRLRFMEVSR